MSKVKLEIQDLERVLYWFHLAYKKKKPSNEDGESLKIREDRGNTEKEKGANVVILGGSKVCWGGMKIEWCTVVAVALSRRLWYTPHLPMECPL